MKWSDCWTCETHSTRNSKEKTEIEFVIVVPSLSFKNRLTNRHLADTVLKETGILWNDLAPSRFVEQETCWPNIILTKCLWIKWQHHSYGRSCQYLVNVSLCRQILKSLVCFKECQCLFIMCRPNVCWSNGFIQKSTEPP
jgi:hypothetical protein